MRYSSLGMLFVSAFGSCDACWDESVDVAPDAVTPSVEHASPNGVGAWSQTADSTGDDTQVAVVADSTGFWVAGAIGGSANIGCGPHATAAAYNGGSRTSVGGLDGFLVTTSLGGDPLVSHGDADGFIAEYTDANAC